jgi:DNA-binding transcriptional LysR family regulator
LHITAAEGVREAVLAGMGLAIGSEWMFAPELAGGQVQRVLRDWRLPPIDLWAVFPTGRRAGDKVRAFADFIEQALRDALPLEPAGDLAELEPARAWSPASSV